MISLIGILIGTVASILAIVVFIEARIKKIKKKIKENEQDSDIKRLKIFVSNFKYATCLTYDGDGPMVTTFEMKFEFIKKREGYFGYVKTIGNDKISFKAELISDGSHIFIYGLSNHPGERILAYVNVEFLSETKSEITGVGFGLDRNGNPMMTEIVFTIIIPDRDKLNQSKDWEDIASAIFEKERKKDESSLGRYHISYFNNPNKEHRNE
ncbi:MAG: hypothetical protein K9N07_11350 [Candidatus Cloacimonetes bacterium]|nr:hypothetical protein [Candidatus Cloacimonadota bacterium]